ncbi:serine/threonine-protein kinase [Streptomyces sp. 35G-GA-8]|uniref:serine/threonine-protein kinase n=1 Tax=Streptomyces sp. 35G-GA-8 TaxID=2939434 RepID=UPI00201F9BBF|nr:serine/threonine-protein kinase [Streptomyces sp. 35G-GA-8]MCL7379497.1 protein kinase [Streptomyces sp. 35G-GA-8]
MGEVFAGRYELIDPIGRGGVGAVWRAWDHRRRRYVAAKVLQQSDAHTLLRFVREQALRIDHPHVLAPASWAADDDKVLFTMDLVSGGSLAHVIGDYGPLPPRFVCTLLDQLLAGLAAVHAEGVVHRDIKPANILLEATGTGRPHLRLSDFGISMRKGEPRLTETNYVVGTPGYFAPEQMMGAEPDFPADLFAVGLVALYLMQGQKPDAKALVEHFTAHGTPGAPQGIPEPLWQVLAGLLQPDPDARFRTATGARKALTTAVELLPEPDIDDEIVEVFDQIGPLPSAFGPAGPVSPASPASPASTVGPASTAGPVTDPRTGGHPSAPYTEASGGPYTDPRTAQPPAGPATASSSLTPPPSTAPSPPPTPAPGPASMSETGSFHLPPPPSRDHAPQQAPQAQPAPQQAYVPPYPAQHIPPHHDYATPPDLSQAETAAVRHEQGHTRPYTAQSPGVPFQQPAVPHPRAPAHRAPAKRVGPPPKVTVPVLLLALACFAVGIWALTQIQS